MRQDGPPGSGSAASARLTSLEIEATGRWISSVQLATGMIPWFPGGHADAWNHTEAAIALLICGRRGEADAAFGWLRRTQQPDGSWCLYHLAEGIEEPRRDPNVAAYVATGVWWHWLETADSTFLEAMWPMVDAAMGFVLRLQAPGGEILWSQDVDGVIGRFALLTATSSILHSLRCATAISAELGFSRPAWETAADRIADVVAHRREVFEPKERWAMDWYYPVLSGALTRQAGAALIAQGWDRFVLGGVGVRCVADQDWVTAAETAECVIALDSIGQHERAAQLLGWTRHLRDDNGSYWTGCVHPSCTRYPGGERSTYTAAAVLMADHVVHGSSVTAGIFRSIPGGREAGSAGGGEDPGGYDRTGRFVEASTPEAARRPDRMHAGSPEPR